MVISRWKVRSWIAGRPGGLEVRPAPAADQSLQLGAGESGAIALGLEFRADARLLDDRKARL